MIERAQEKGYRVYLHARWFITNAVAALTGLLLCLAAALYSQRPAVVIPAAVLALVAFGIMILNIIPLFRLREPCIVCTSKGIRLRLRLQLLQQNGNSYLGPLREFIPWEQIHGIYLMERRSWYSLQGARFFCINYSHHPHERQATRHCEIFLKQLDVHAESMYNHLVYMYSRYKR